MLKVTTWHNRIKICYIKLKLYFSAWNEGTYSIERDILSNKNTFYRIRRFFRLKTSLLHREWKYIFIDWKFIFSRENVFLSRENIIYGVKIYASNFATFRHQSSPAVCTRRALRKRSTTWEYWAKTCPAPKFLGKRCTTRYLDLWRPRIWLLTGQVA